jgi:hypothetical protein
LDRRYQLARRFEAVKALSFRKWQEAEEAERKYQLRFRISSAAKAAYEGVIDTTASLFNAKDRKELVKKLPVRALSLWRLHDALGRPGRDLPDCHSSM